MVQEVTTTSWGKRIMNAFAGALFGIALILGAFFLVFWNEGNGLHTAQSLDQTEKVLISVANAPIDNKNDQRVIYTSGQATTDDILSDKLFNVAEKAIQLNRKVEMYQWKENVETTTEKQMGGSEQEVKTYSYKQIWSPDEIDSSEFKEQTGHQNPSSMPIKSKIQFAKTVTVGDFSLPADLIQQISGDTVVSLNQTDLAALKTKFNKPVTAVSDGLYIGEDDSMPKIGDLRVTMTSVLPETVSVIAEQSGKNLEAYMAPAGTAVSLIEMGQVSSQQLIHDAKVQNEIMTWLLRLASLLMFIFGLVLIMQPVTVLADVVPLFGSLVGFGTGLIAFAGGLALWMISFAIAWFVVRPILAVAMIVLAVLIFYLLLRHKK